MNEIIKFFNPDSLRSMKKQKNTQRVKVSTYCSLNGDGNQKAA